MPWRERPTSSSSVKLEFSETGKPINAKFGGKIAIHHISRPFSGILKMFRFYLFSFHRYIYLRHTKTRVFPENRPTYHNNIQCILRIGHGCLTMRFTWSVIKYGIEDWRVTYCNSLRCSNLVKLQAKAMTLAPKSLHDPSAAITKLKFSPRPSS